MPTRWACTALLAMAALACAGPRPRSRERTSSSVGKPLALVAPDLDGHDVDLGAGTGKVRVVDFWATWCEPCKEAMPVLDRMARELGPRGLEVYGVSVDDDRAQIRRFLDQHPVNFAILWDKDAVRLSRLDVSFMPVTLLVDRSGVIRHVHQGWDASRGRQEREEVEALLAER